MGIVFILFLLVYSGLPAAHVIRAGDQDGPRDQRVRASLSTYREDPNDITRDALHDSLQDYLAGLKESLSTAPREPCVLAHSNVKRLRDDICVITTEVHACNMIGHEDGDAQPTVSWTLADAWKPVEVYVEEVLATRRRMQPPADDGWLDPIVHERKRNTPIVDRMEELRLAVELLCFRVCGDASCPPDLVFSCTVADENFRCLAHELVSELLIEYAEVLPVREHCPSPPSPTKQELEDAQDILLHLLDLGAQALLILDGREPEFPRLLPRKGCDGGRRTLKISKTSVSRTGLYLLVGLVFSTLAYLNLLMWRRS